MRSKILTFSAEIFKFLHIICALSAHYPHAPICKSLIVKALSISFITHSSYVIIS